MTSPSEWVPHIHAFVDLNLSQEQHDTSLDTIASFINHDLLTMEALVKEMEMYLTTTDAVIRARGILLLAHILARILSKPLTAAAIHSLIEFFTSRLEDWQVLRGGLIGCLALIRRNDSVGMVSEGDAIKLAQSFLENLQVQALAQEDRKLCFELLECLLSVYPNALRPLGDDLVYGVCEAIDEEKDPWCLLHCFHIVELLVDLFPNPSGPVASFSKDIFEILGRYFPIYFTHAKDDALDVKREDLSRALMLALSSTPLFEPFCIPLLLEKLASSLKIAKLDALKYLSHCVMRYGPDRMSNHAKAIWLSLKDIIFTSSEPITSFTSELLEEPKENEFVKEALMCLANCILVCDGSNECLLPLIVQDDDLIMTFSSITRDDCWEHMSTESRKRLHAVGSILSASAKVSATCCTMIFENFFPRLMEEVGISSGGPLLDSNSDGNHAVSSKLNSGALFLCIELVTVGRHLAVDLASQEVSFQSDPLQHGWFHLLQNFAEPLALGLGSALLTAKDAANINKAIEEADGIYVVRCLQILATFPGRCSPSSKDMFEYILRGFVLVIIEGCVETVLWKHSLKGLVQIGISIEKFGDSEKCISYRSVVIESLLLWLANDDSALPLSSKLEAACDVATTGIDFVIRIIEGLKAFLSSNFIEALVKGNQDCAKIATSVLGCLSGRLLPWLQEKGRNDEVYLLFSESLWLYLDATPEINLGLQGHGLFDALMVVMRLVVAYCTEEHQALIVQKAYHILMAKTSSLYRDLECFAASALMETLRLAPASDVLCSNDKWIISLLSSVIIALRPHVLLPDVKMLLKIFTVSALAGLEAAAQALGSMINKWPAPFNTDSGNACTLEEAVNFMLEIVSQNAPWNSHKGKIQNLDSSRKSIMHFNIDEELLFDTCAIVGLAWIGKGLVMRGHEKAKDIAMLLLSCLLSSRVKVLTLQNSLGNDSTEDISCTTSRCAADAFHIITSDSEVSLNKTFHASIRPLYKQRFYTSMIPLINQAIRESNYSVTKSMLYRAFGHIICNTPLAALLSEADKIIPLLLDGLQILSEDELNKNLIYSLLLVLSGMLMDENGKGSILENVPAIVNNLVRLVAFPHMMIVRETAIQCLVAITGLPQAKVYPYRRQVLKAIKKALDDRKRSVRQEAVRCHQAWASIS